jgi:hypothetical protein
LSRCPVFVGLSRRGRELVLHDLDDDAFDLNFREVHFSFLRLDRPINQDIYIIGLIAIRHFIELRISIACADEHSSFAFSGLEDVHLATTAQASDKDRWRSIWRHKGERSEQHQNGVRAGKRKFVIFAKQTNSRRAIHQIPGLQNSRGVRKPPDKSACDSLRTMGLISSEILENPVRTYRGGPCILSFRRNLG